jgi:hypothetical protein
MGAVADMSSTEMAPTEMPAAMSSTAGHGRCTEEKQQHCCNTPQRRPRAMTNNRRSV